MNTPFQSQNLEANLEELRARLPELPVARVLLGRLLLHLGRGMASLFEHQIRPFGLAEAEFRVLTSLFSQPDGIAHPSELCARTSQSPANMSRISDALVSRDFITRVPSVQDRRKMVLRITEPGEELVRRALPTLLALLDDMFEEFSEEEVRQLVSQLKLLGAKVDAALAQHGSERGA